MSIQSEARFVDALWDWGFLEGAFANPHIRLSDVDGTVEVNGRFLYIEAKGPRTRMPVGQDIYFRRRIDDGRSTVIYVWGQPGCPEAFQILGCMQDPEWCDLDRLFEAVRDWSNWAESPPRPQALSPCWPGCQQLGTRFSRN